MTHPQLSGYLTRAALVGMAIFCGAARGGEDDRSYEASSAFPWQVAEIDLTSSKTYANPYGEVDVKVTFTGPRGKSVARPAFWDGGSAWKVRFAPTAVGSWNWQTECSDQTNDGLNGRSGRLECLPAEGGESNNVGRVSRPVRDGDGPGDPSYEQGNPPPRSRHGFLKVSDNRRHFVHADGTPFFWLGDTHWQMPDTERLDACNHPKHAGQTCPHGGQFQHLVADRRAKGFTVYHEYSYGPSRSPGTLRNLDPGVSYRADWFDPRTGTWTPIDTGLRADNGQWKIPIRPDGDWVLVVRKRDDQIRAQKADVHSDMQVAVSEAPQLESRGRLWANGVETPAVADLGFPAGIQHVRVERSDSDKYKFLHDPAIEVHKGELFAAWYNCPQQEIVGESLIRCRRSKDGGKTWGAVEVIASDTSGDGTYYVPAQLLSHGGALHAFVGTMKGGHDLIKSCAVYVLDEATNRWLPRGEIAGLFLPNCQPIKMADGNWIMAGRAASRFGVKPRIPAVAISQGDDLTGRWNVVPLRAEMTPAHCPETAVWAEDSELVALTRNNARPAPFLHTSDDFGRTWRRLAGHDFSAVTSKMYAGRLSTGQYYVVFNYPTVGERGGHDRSVLAVAVSRPGEFALSRAWRVQDHSTPDRPPASHYPSAIEHEDRLLILYTAGWAGCRQCELAIIPLTSLQVTPR